MNDFENCSDCPTPGEPCADCPVASDSFNCCSTDLTIESVTSGDSLVVESQTFAEPLELRVSRLEQDLSDAWDLLERLADKNAH